MGHFQYMAGQLDMAKEVYPTRAYLTAGLLAGARKRASSPGDLKEPPEGIAVGNPDQIIRELKKWEATGVDRVSFLLNAAETIPQQQVLDSLRLFAEEVMPHFADDSAAEESRAAAVIAEPVALAGGGGELFNGFADRLERSGDFVAGHLLSGGVAGLISGVASHSVVGEHPAGVAGTGGLSRVRLDAGVWCRKLENLGFGGLDFVGADDVSLIVRQRVHLIPC